MNTTKVLIGGIAAGVVLFLSDIGGLMVFGGRMAADFQAAGLSEPAMTAGLLITTALLDVGLGIALVWLYAAIRVRFGPGMQTATYAGLFVWLLAGVFGAGFVILGILSTATFLILSVYYLVAVILAAWVGGRLYSEEAAAPAMAATA